MLSSIVFAISFGALALAQAENTTISYSNANTAYLTETNSLGVVTGMPTVVTSQPSVVTSQASAAEVPAGFTGLTTRVSG